MLQDASTSVGALMVPSRGDFAPTGGKVAREHCQTPARKLLALMPGAKTRLGGASDRPTLVHSDVRIQVMPCLAPGGLMHVRAWGER
jgi:hypothetical protein